MYYDYSRIRIYIHISYNLIKVEYSGPTSFFLYLEQIIGLSE